MRSVITHKALLLPRKVIMRNYKRKGYNPKSLNNLKRMQDRPPSERRELGRKGGRITAKKYREGKVSIRIKYRYNPSEAWITYQEAVIRYHSKELLVQALYDAIMKLSEADTREGTS